MAKQAVATTSEKRPAYLDKYADDAGKGISTSAADNLVPLAKILQKMSPEVEERDPKYVPGAKPSDILLKGSINPLIKGTEGFIFQPCFYQIEYIEWVDLDKGGGFVARHLAMPDDAKQTIDPNERTTKFIRPNGNEVIEYRNYYGYVLLDGLPPMAYIVPFKGAGHTIAREWMTKQQQVSDRAFAAAWKLKTRMRTNQKGSWFDFDIQPCNEPNQFVSSPPYVSEQQYLLGRELNGRLERRELQGAAPEADRQSQTEDESKPF